MNMGDLEENAEMVKKKVDETGDQGLGEWWRADTENREVQRYSIVKYCESEDKLE